MFRLIQCYAGYVGSYAMDALCMALHCLWTTDNFVDCMLKVIATYLGGEWVIGMGQVLFLI